MAAGMRQPLYLLTNQDIGGIICKEGYFMTWVSKYFTKYFINGLIVIVPFFVTAFVVISIFSFVEDLLGRYMPVHFPGIGIIAVVIIIVLTGWLSSYWILKRLLLYGEQFLDTIPVIKFIYKSMKQLSTAFFESHQIFQHAVLVPYPHPGAKALGFIMSPLSNALSDKLEEEHVCVFLPMSLNMTSGLNIIVPKRDIIFLNVSNESVLQYILTAGSIMPSGSIVNK